MLDQVRAAEPGDPAAALQRWIDQDRKATPLKTIQGRIWAEGYASGAFKGHVYPDAAQALRAWHAAGIRLYVYSSGSVEAQQLIFRHRDQGDLEPLFSGWFDTTTGPKREAASYVRIVSAIGEAADAILFSIRRPGRAGRGDGCGTAHPIDRSNRRRRCINLIRRKSRCRGRQGWPRANSRSSTNSGSAPFTGFAPP